MKDEERALRLVKARQADAGVLAEISGRAFEDDIHYGAPGPGGPPGYNSADWQARIMRVGQYYKILYGRAIIGGLIVFPKGNRHYELGRIFIDPAYQNRGLGAEVIALMESLYPLAARWTLGTPRWNRRTQHFYEKMGYVRAGYEGSDGVLYEKRMVRQEEDPRP